MEVSDFGLDSGRQDAVVRLVDNQWQDRVVDPAYLDQVDPRYRDTVKARLCYLLHARCRGALEEHKLTKAKHLLSKAQAIDSDKALGTEKMVRSYEEEHCKG